MAQLFRLNEKWPYPLMPSEYVQRQFHVSFQDDPVAVACRHITGLSTIVWGNDYPHAEGTFRGSRQLIAEQFAGVPDAERDAMIGGTLGGLLGLQGSGGRLSDAGTRDERSASTAASPSSPARAAASARAYALLLAARGAARRGQRPRRRRSTEPGPTPARRREVADEITAAGGSALADTSDVATAAGAAAVVDAALERFGRLDILINNAGIIRWAGFPEADEDNLARHLAVHTVGSFNTARAAWPHLVDAGLRPDRHDHLERCLRAAQQHLVRHGQGRGHRSDAQPRHRRAEHGIKVNLIAPAAMTRMAGGGGPADDDTGARRPHGGLPRPRVVPGHGRDLRGRRRALRPALHRGRRRATCTPRRT